jgi:hypothetical protein
MLPLSKISVRSALRTAWRLDPAGCYSAYPKIETLYQSKLSTYLPRVFDSYNRSEDSSKLNMRAWKKRTGGVGGATQEHENLLGIEIATHKLRSIDK